MRKRILSALLAVMFLFTGLPGTAWAVGEGNMEAGGGQTETVTGDSFWNGQWGIRFCVVDVVSQSVVSATYDASNYGGLSNYWHYGKTNKFDYRNGATLTIRQGNYCIGLTPFTLYNHLTKRNVTYSLEKALHFLLFKLNKKIMPSK